MKNIFISLVLLKILFISQVFAAEQGVAGEEEAGNQSIGIISAILSNELITGIVFAIVTLVATLFISKMIQSKVSSMLEGINGSGNLREEVYSMVAKSTNIGVWVFGISLAASFVQLDLGIFMGGIGIGIGFGLQALLSNFISGIIVVIQGNYSVGNVIKIMGNIGTIRQMNTLFTEVEQFDGVKFYIPNSKFLSETVENIHANDKRRVEIMVGVDYSTDLVKAKTVISKVLDSFPNILKAPSYSIIITEFDDSSIGLKIMFWINIDDNIFTTKSNVMETINLAFKQSDIKIPFPQITISNR